MDNLKCEMYIPIFYMSFSLKSDVILFVLVGIVAAWGGGMGHGNSGGHGGHGGGHSGEHGSSNCTIVPSNTTNCTGVTGSNCSDSTALRVQLIFIIF